MFLDSDAWFHQDVGRRMKCVKTIHRRWGSGPLQRAEVRRSFLAWFAENRYRFVIPVRIVSRRSRIIQLQFEGITRHIEVYLGRRELAVDVIHRGRWFDRMLDNDICLAVRRSGGWVCDWSDQAEKGRVYATKQALWRAHLWEPLLTWVNEDLATARWVRLAKSSGCQDAQLITDERMRHVVGRLHILGRMVGLTGQPVLAPGGPIEFWLYPVRGDGVVEHFTGTLPDRNDPDT